MLVIRLTRVGKKNSPAYRVVVAEQKKAVNRKFIEIIGNYNPTTNPKTIVINKEKSLAWIAKGAQPSDTVRNLMVDLGILAKGEKTDKKYSKPTKKKDAGKEPEVKEETTSEKEPENAEETEVSADETPAASAQEEAVSEEVTPEESTESAPSEETPSEDDTVKAPVE